MKKLSMEKMTLAVLVIAFGLPMAKDKVPVAAPAKEMPKTDPAAPSASAVKPKGCMPSPESMDSLLLIVQQARKSGDKAKMIVALEATESHIGEMKEHKKKCKGMMEDMMGGGGMMGMKGMKAKDADSAVAPAVKEGSKPAPDSHEKHH